MSKLYAAMFTEKQLYNPLVNFRLPHIELRETSANKTTIPHFLNTLPALNIFLEKMPPSHKIKKEHQIMTIIEDYSNPIF